MRKLIFFTCLLLSPSFVLFGQDLIKGLAQPLVALAVESPDEWKKTGAFQTSERSEEIPSSYYALSALEVSQEEAAFVENLASPAISLISYQAKVMPNETQITWTLGQPELVEKLALQKSTDGLSWTDFKLFTAEDITEDLWGQTVADGQVAKGLSYYRLAQSLQTGEVHYSPALIVDRFRNGHHISHLYPNPTIFGTMVQLELYQASQVEIKLIDAENRSLGKIHTAFASLGRHEIELDLSKLPKKKYICEIRVGNYLATREILP